MERFIKRRRVALRLGKNMLGKYIHLLAEKFHAEGYARGSICNYFRIIEHFGTWLSRRDIRVEQLNQQHVKTYQQYRKRIQRPDHAVAAALKHVFKLFRQMGVLPKVAIKETRTSRIERDFEHYLLQERVVSPKTVIAYVPFIRQLLNYRLGKGQVDISALQAKDIISFVQYQAPRLHAKRAKVMTTALRSFLQYSRYRGYIRVDLAGAVPSVANWSLATVPTFLRASEVRRVLATCNRRTAKGRRDYAILLLLARLGLRSGEIAALTLDDIDWQAGAVTVRGKGGTHTQLPLPIDVGAAIVAYLKNGRPRIANRSLFLTARAPIGGFMRQQVIGSVVKHAIVKAQIDSPRKGAHQFRHILATRMLRRGASLAEIGRVLRHRSPQSTQIYAKVDLHSLRSLALPWPGGEK